MRGLPSFQMQIFSYTFSLFHSTVASDLRGTVTQVFSNPYKGKIFFFFAFCLLPRTAILFQRGEFYKRQKKAPLGANLFF